MAVELWKSAKDMDPETGALSEEIYELEQKRMGMLADFDHESQEAEYHDDVDTSEIDERLRQLYKQKADILFGRGSEHYEDYQRAAILYGSAGEFELVKKCWLLIAEKLQEGIEIASAGNWLLKEIADAYRKAGEEVKAGQIYGLMRD